MTFIQDHTVPFDVGDWIGIALDLLGAALHVAGECLVCCHDNVMRSEFLEISDPAQSDTMSTIHTDTACWEDVTIPPAFACKIPGYKMYRAASALQVLNSVRNSHKLSLIGAVQAICSLTAPNSVHLLVRIGGTARPQAVN